MVNIKVQSENHVKKVILSAIAKLDGCLDNKAYFSLFFKAVKGHWKNLFIII